MPNESGIFEPPYELFEKPENEPEEPPKPSGWQKIISYFMGN